MPPNRRRNPPANNSPGMPEEKTKTAKKKKRTTQLESYKPYIRELLSGIKPEKEISRTSIRVLNSFVTELFDKIAKEASSIAQYKNKNKETLTVEDIDNAAHLLLPAEIARCATEAGERAVQNFHS